MTALLPLLLLTVATIHAGTVLDRIAVIVGKRVIKLSDIDRDLRLTEFLNREPLDLSAQRKRQSAERLIDQEIIRNDLAAGGYRRATDAQAEGFFRQILHERFGDSQQRLDAELRRYGVTENDLKAELLWQLTVLDFIQQRFQPEVSVSDDEVHTYYNGHLNDLRRQHGANSSFEVLAPQIRAKLEAEAVNKNFEDWLSRARQHTRIEYREGAFT
jgi:hypothetical protein